MAPDDAPPPPPGASAPGEDPLDALSARIEAASRAAERLVAEATASVRDAAADPGAAGDGPQGRPPPRGWATPGAADGDRERADAAALVAIIELGRGLIPPELREQLVELFRELLLAVRALIDWYLERLEARRNEQREVEDIPIS
jgi:hypothetical protein